MRVPNFNGIAFHRKKYSDEGFIGKDIKTGDEYVAGYVYKYPQTGHFVVLVFSLKKKWRPIDFQKVEDFIKHELLDKVTSWGCPCHFCNPKSVFTEFPYYLLSCYICKKPFKTAAKHAQCAAEYQESRYKDIHSRCNNCYGSIDDDINDHRRCLLEMSNKMEQASADKRNLALFNESIEKYMEAVRMQIKSLRTELTNSKNTES